MRYMYFKKLNPEKVFSIRSMFSRGNSLEDISKKFNVHKTTVWYWVQPEEKREEARRKAIEYYRSMRG